MPTVKNGTVYYAAHPVDKIVPGVTTKYVEDEIDLETVPLNGGVLIKVIALSSDPYMRYRMREPESKHATFCPPLKIGQPIDNSGVGRVLRSEDAKFNSGDLVHGYLTFQEYSIFPGPPEFQHALKWLQKLEKPSSIPASVYTGTLGAAGKSAFAAFDAFATEKAKQSKTIFVSAAAGPVGTFVCEYAKVINPTIKVIGSAGSPAKVDILRSIGVDVPVNYKEQDVEAVLREHGPIDIYWDNVAGNTLDAALLNMNTLGLIVACGAISAASKGGVGTDVKHFEEIFQRSLTIKGFVLSSPEVIPSANKFLEVAVPLFVEGKITSREHRFTLREAGEALLSVHNGTNVGKAVIIVDEAA